MTTLPNPTKPGRWKATFGVLLCLILSPSVGRALGPSEELFELSAKDLAGGSGRTTLPAVWKYRFGDDPSFAAHGFDDTTWDEVDIRLGKSGPSGWPGLGWFRLHFRVDPDLQDVALSLLVRQTGAAEIYLDGELLFGLGTVDAEAERAVGRYQRQPHLFAFDNRAEHVLAIRYCHHDSAAGAAAGRVPGFVVTIGNANHRLSVYSEEIRSHSAYRAFFTGVFASFALLHLLLFIFYPEARENLYFALLAISVAVLVYLFLHREATTDPRFIDFSDRGLNITWLLLCVSAAGFVYSVFEERMPRRFPRFFYLLLGAAAVLLVPGWIWPRALTPWILLLVFLTSLEMCRSVMVALYRRKPGARIVGLGILILAAGFAIGLAASLDVLPSSMATVFLIPFYSMFFLMVTMSVYLSRKFAHANRELRTQLMQVEELSEHKLEQERLAREVAVERTRLEAEYARKVEELEDARKLQLSMLPEHLPDLPDLEVAAGMHTATEVGGDYYDFDVASDGTLTVAIGDATGHGMRAGTMVTATKSLFHTLGQESDLSQTLSRFTHALKRMNLRQLSMALTLVRFKDGRLHLAAAGMPPALIWRAASKRVEAFEIAGAPLGSLTGFPYQQTELHLAPGDTLLLMSDGFPERLNGDHEMLGYDKAQESFTRAAPTSPQTIIERLVADGDAWAAGQPALDDMTFVVLKMRGASMV